MTSMIILGHGGAVDKNRVVAIAPFKSKPIKRLLDAAGVGKVVNLTYGYPRQSVLLMDNGYLIVTSRSVDELIAVIQQNNREERIDGNQARW